MSLVYVYGGLSWRDGSPDERLSAEGVRRNRLKGNIGMDEEKLIKKIYAAVGAAFITLVLIAVVRNM